MIRDGIGLGNARSSKAKLLGRAVGGDRGASFRSMRVGTSLENFEIRSSGIDRDVFNDFGSVEGSIPSEMMLPAGLTSRRLGAVDPSPR